ncbi:peptidase [Solibacillus sp. R5-41]|uniref:M1 family metallopeptidase n=1 Tax=Solibacillus sp. R5-41 TaxID=2048654 RepID=UPI000C12965E|nr:M1 family metallopeptidase [Solibacillus sp. R5-41]ATP40863.1 peptidase [Solibacillus sp. R5-41]
MKKTLFICVLSIFLLIGCSEVAFNPNEEPAGSQSNYDMKLSMDNNGLFSADISIDILNVSNEKWDELKLYFIPNMFTSENSPQLTQPSEVEIESVKVENQDASYSLEKDTINIPLKTSVSPNESINFQMKYHFTLPTDGFRFEKIDSNYHLAQWYPMVPTYQKGWNKQDYTFKGESYHTTFSNFNLTFDIPKEYTLVTTSDEDSLLNENNNSFRIENVKEIFVALLKDPQVVQKKSDSVNIRVFGTGESEEFLDEVMETAVESFDYFDDIIGPYPHKQLDIILDGPGMEYPGVVTAGSLKGRSVTNEGIKNLVIHEIAHQWFYGIISNDPYTDGWLDEGIAEIATTLFLMGNEKELGYIDFSDKIKPLPSNLPLHEYLMSTPSNYIYGQSYSNLAKIFNQYGGKQTAEDFLRRYYTFYKYKEVKTDEFVRFMKFYLELKDDSLFESWLELGDTKK